MKKFCLATWFLSALAATASEVWTNRLEISDRHALATFGCRWSRDGLKLQLVATNHATIEVRLAPGRPADLRFEPSRLFPDGLEDEVQTWPAPAAATNVVVCALRRQSHAWMLYLADQPVARLPEPWAAGSVVIRHPVAALPPGRDDRYVQRTAPFRFEDNFLVPKSDGKEEAPKLPELWERRSGDWHLHCVTGMLSGTVRQLRLGRQPTPEHSPNFYSLEGCGNRAVVLSGESFQHRYAYRAAVQHNGGTNGLLFLVTDGGACLGFTARTDPASERLVFDLWRGGVDAGAPRQILATVGTELLPGQWTLLEAHVFDDRVACLVDNIEILRHRLPLPPGGRFGLYADTAEGTRFDDVAVVSHEEYPFESAADLRFHTLQRDGTFRNRTSAAPLAPAGGEPAAVALDVPGDREPRAWIFGATDDAPHKLEICADVPADGDWSLALLSGWQSPAEPGFRFVCRQAGGRRLATLERAGGRTVLDAADLGPAAAGPLRLTLDALRPNELRGLVNGRLAVLDRPPAALRGAGGVRLEGRERVRLSLPQYVSSAPVFADRFEKNPAYVNDPYMRNWSSPEGQWITMPNGLTWLRGDVMGRVKVRLPAVEGSVLHLAVPEDASNGACRVALRGGRLAVYTPAGGTGAVFAVAVTNIPEEKVENAGNLRLYTVNLEDDLLWLATDATILGRCHLPPLPKGRRLRVEGLDLANLHQTLVRRENVFDTLFNESLHDWTVNGGTWEIVNRFACEPSWSHMNGENGDGFAGLWSKIEVSGDFCAELYAGTRMGWYERPGDFNLTVDSRRGATCDGYSVTTAGWDPDWSQLYTRLFRNGATCAVSSVYTAPRVRDGSKREGYEPLVPKGARDVHGAWYGLRFRRVGDRLSVFFDNDPVLAWRDPAPLASGSLGLWTYRNSIMVARIRIAAESIRPRPFRFWPEDAGAVAPAAAVAAAVPGVRVNGRPPEWLDPAVWTDADPISRPQIRFRPGSDGRPEMTVTALEGGGTFLAAPRLPPLPAAKLLGWRFDVARHPEARFNFEFSAGRRAASNVSLVAIGTVSATGVTTPAVQLDGAAGYSFVISGSDETRGERKLAGRLDRPPPASAADAEGRGVVWTPVEVWLPTELLRSDRLVVVEGFGNLQPSDVQQGLAGNPPGAWYAVRNFREVYSGFPDLEGPPAVRPELDAFSQAAARLPPGRLQERRLPATLDSRTPLVAWAVRPEAEFGLAARLDDLIPDALRVTSILPWPSPFLPARGASLDGAALPGWQEGNDYVALLPRGETPAADRGLFALQLADGRTFRQSVPLAGAPGAPVLVECEMPEGGLQTFEQRPVDPQRHLGRAGFALACTDPQQGTCIRFQNSGLADGRLDGRLLPEYDPVLTPLLQFRYKADPMAHVGLSVARCTIGFSEEGWGASAGPGATGVLDNAWHTWIGTPLQAVVAGMPLRSGYVMSPGELRVAARGSRDQTGRYSTLAFDDIAAGPAVGPHKPLAFRLHYSCRGGVAEVRYALVAGRMPWTERDDDARAAVRWLAVTNLQAMVPDLSGLPEGAHHLVTRARNSAGAWSAVYDLPFLVDRQPPIVTHAVRDVPDRYNGTCLGLAIQGGFAPPVVRNLRLTCDGKPLDLTHDNGTVSYAGAEVGFEIDWPWLLRKARKDRKDGDTLTIVVEGIADAAGNEAPAYSIPIKLAYANDKQPPAVNPPAATTNLLVWSPQFKRLQDFFNSAQQVTALEAKQENGCWFVPFQSAGAPGTYLARQAVDKPWDVEAFPWLALSVRLEGEGAPAGTNAPFALQLRPAGNLPDGAVKPKNGTYYSWNLPTADGQHFVLGHVDWRAGRWNDILVNVRDLLREQAKVDKAPPLRQLDLAFPNQAKFTLQVRGCSILAPWGPADTLKFQAYDLSGVAGLAWQNGGKSAKTGLRPARLALPPDDAQWLKLRVADRAGNLSPVFMVPVPPPNAPIPENLPLEVDVENY